MEILSQWFTFMLFQTRKALVHLRNTNILIHLFHFDSFYDAFMTFIVTWTPGNLSGVIKKL